MKYTAEFSNGTTVYSKAPIEKPFQCETDRWIVLIAYILEN